MNNNEEDILDSVFHSSPDRVPPSRHRARGYARRGNDPTRGLPTLRRSPPREERGDGISEADSMTGTDTDSIKVGDRVTYLVVHGNATGDALGKVLGIFQQYVLFCLVYFDRCVLLTCWPHPHRGTIVSCVKNDTVP